MFLRKLESTVSFGVSIQGYGKVEEEEVDPGTHTNVPFPTWYTFPTWYIALMQSLVLQSKRFAGCTYHKTGLF